MLRLRFDPAYPNILLLETLIVLFVIPVVETTTLPVAVVYPANATDTPYVPAPGTDIQHFPAPSVVHVPIVVIPLVIVTVAPEITLCGTHAS